MSAKTKAIACFGHVDRTHQHTNTPTHQNTYKLEFGDGISLITLITQIKLLFADAKIELTSNLIKTSSEMWL